MRAHSGNWIGVILSVFPVETWDLDQCLFRHEPVDAKRMGRGPSSPGFPALLLLLGREGSAGMRTRGMTRKEEQVPSCPQPGATPNPPQLPLSSPKLGDPSRWFRLLRGASTCLGQQNWAGLLTLTLQEKFTCKVSTHPGPFL